MLAHELLSIEAYKFHLWLSALGGCSDAQIECSKYADKNGDTSLALEWLKLASRRSRRACSLMVGMIDEKLEHFPKLIEVYECALTVKDDKLSDIERLENMELCDFEIHEKLGQYYHSLLNAESNKTSEYSEGKFKRRACEHYRQAAELATTVGRFKLSTTCLERVDLINSS